MNWSQILLVTKREYITQIRDKTFIILTFLTPLIMIGLGALIAFFVKANKDQKTVAVVDQSQLFSTSFKSNEEISYHFYTAQDIDAIKDTLEDSETLNALLVIPNSSDYDSIEKGTDLYTKGSSGFNFKLNIEGKLEKTLSQLKMKNAGLSDQQLEEIKSSFDLNVYNLKNSSEKDGELQKDSSLNDIVKLAISGVLTYVIFMFIMIYGVKVMRSVTEEKSSRVIEVIISSIKPFNLMMGKIFGVTLVALTQFIIWGILFSVLGFIVYGILGLSTASQVSGEQLQQAQEMMNSGGISDKINEVIQNILSINYPLILICFVLYFLLGYLFYSSIFAAIGAAVDNDSDTQQFTFLPMFPMIISLYGSYFTIIHNPEGPVAFWLSIIPLTSPISMITRLPYEVAWWEIALSLGLLLISTIIMVRLGAKIYRVGILMYGKKTNFKELWKWLKYSG